MVSTGLVVFAAGWIAAGAAQDTPPDFEFIVRAPAGETVIECVKGCGLAWVERGRLRGEVPKSTFNFGCSGVGNTTASRCSSGRVGGWITAASDKD